MGPGNLPIIDKRRWVSWELMLIDAFYGPIDDKNFWYFSDDFFHQKVGYSGAQIRLTKRASMIVMMYYLPVNRKVSWPENKAIQEDINLSTTESTFERS